MKAQDNDGDPTYTFDTSKPQKANITERDVERCINARELLLEKIEILGKKLPPNTLDKLISDLGGTNLGALTQGDRRATDARDLSQFNIDNSIGRSALESVMQQLTREKPTVRYNAH